jgi:hypothetical protein
MTNIKNPSFLIVFILYFEILLPQKYIIYILKLNYSLIRILKSNWDSTQILLSKYINKLRNNLMLLILQHIIQRPFFFF